MKRKIDWTRFGFVILKLKLTHVKGDVHIEFWGFYEGYI